MRGSAALNGHPRFHNISDLLDDLEEPYCVDATHLSEPGNRLVAAAMVEDVIKLIESAPRGAFPAPLKQSPRQESVHDQH